MNKGEAAELIRANESDVPFGGAGVYPAGQDLPETTNSGSE